MRPLPSSPRKSISATIALCTAVALGPAEARPAPGAPDRGLVERIDLALKRGGLRGARVGILIADLATGETLYERGPDELLTPASLTKIVTSAAALSVLKPQYRFRTALYGTGRQVASTWKGDLWLKAWGDPALVQERLWMLSHDLKKRGIRSIEGSLKVDDSFFDRERFGADWGSVTRAWYNAPNGAVSVNYNMVESRGRYIAIEGDPSRYAGRYLADLLKQQGVDLTGAVEHPATLPPDAQLLAASESKPLGEILSDLNKISNNFIAEQVLKTLGAETELPPGSAVKGTRAVAAYLKGLGISPESFQLFDGSGLSHSNRLTPRLLVRVLSAALRDFESGPEFLTSLKVAGVDGKSTRFQDPICRRRMRMKTGHLFGVAGLAGFGETVGGRRVVFAIMANEYRRGRHAADRGIEEICEAFLLLGAPEGMIVAHDILGGSASEASAEGLSGPAVLGPDGAELGDDPLDEEGD